LDTLAWLATIGGLAAAYLGAALLLVALDRPARSVAPVPDEGPEVEDVAGYRDVPSTAGDAVVLQAAEGGPTADLRATARALGRFGIARVYVPEGDTPLDDAGLAGFVQRLEADGKPAPAALMTRGACGSIETRFLGGRYGCRRGAPPIQHFRARDVARLGYRLIEGESDTALIVLHGAGSHGEPYAALGYALAGLGPARVFLPDLRGHHGSYRRGDVDRVDRHETDLADLIVHVRDTDPGSQVVVAGHSAGGGLALRFACGPHGHLADAYLLLAPYLGPAAPVHRARAGEGWAEPARLRMLGLAMLDLVGLRGLDGLPVLGFHPPDCVRDGRETLVYSFRILKSLSPPRDYARGLHAAGRRPLLVLIGDEDEIFDPDRFTVVVDRHAPGCARRVAGATHLGIVYSAEAHRLAAEWLAGLNTTMPMVAPEESRSGFSFTSQ
jgi:pimeloyl-ACP methyl ester carboxylesterase